MVKISYGTARIFDGDDASSWTEFEDGTTGTTTTDNESWYKLDVTVAAGNKVYLAASPTSLNYSTTVYPKIRFRYYCSNASIKAKIDVVFDDASTQTLLAETNSTGVVVGTATFTTAKTIDYLRVYANGATGTVYYDFLQIFQDDFTFHNFHDMNIPLYILQDAVIPIPSRTGDVEQVLGSHNLVVTFWCDLDVDNDTNDWKRPQGNTTKTDYMKAQVIVDIMHYMSFFYAWEWLDLEDPPMQFKARLVEPSALNYSGDSHRLFLGFREFRHSNADDETSVERFSLDQ